MCLGWEGLASAPFSNWPSAQPSHHWACLVPREPTRIGGFSGTHHERDAVCIPQILGATSMAPKSQILKSLTLKLKLLLRHSEPDSVIRLPKGNSSPGICLTLSLPLLSESRKGVCSYCLSRVPVRTNACEIIITNHKVYSARVYEWSSGLWPQCSGGWGRRQKVLRTPGLYNEQAGLGYSMVAVLKRRK